MGVNYVIILNTNAGLWGYNIGDTVKFVSINPYRIIVTGRIKHFTSAFGEHVMAEEVEKSLKKSLKKFPLKINEIHSAQKLTQKMLSLPFHEWFIEFKDKPNNLDLFAKDLDKNLQELNSLLQRFNSGKSFTTLKISPLKRGAFREYMAQLESWVVKTKFLGCLMIER